MVFIHPFIYSFFNLYLLRYVLLRTSSALFLFPWFSSLSLDLTLMQLLIFIHILDPYNHRLICLPLSRHWHSALYCIAVYCIVYGELSSGIVGGTSLFWKCVIFRSCLVPISMTRTPPPFTLLFPLPHLFWHSPTKRKHWFKLALKSTAISSASTTVYQAHPVTLTSLMRKLAKRTAVSCLARQNWNWLRLTSK